jgi:hypothetical protein
MSEIELGRLFMKTFLTAAALLIMGCNDASLQSSTAPRMTSDVTSENERLVTAIRNAGFNPAGFVQNDSLVLVEGDIVLRKESLLRGGDSSFGAARSQQRYDGVLYGSVAQQISVNINAFPALKNQMQEAIEYWNSTNSRVNFHLTTSNADVGVYGSNTGLCADSRYDAQVRGQIDPSDPHNIEICDGWESKGYSFTSNFIHELGHVVGLAHSNETGGYRIQGTLNPDPNSIMTNVIDLGDNFDYWDYIGISHLYPVPMNNGVESVFYNYLYQDLNNAYGSDWIATLNHFAKYGINEERIGSVIFNAKFYKSANPDVVKARGTSPSRALQHWNEFGINEKRKSSQTYNPKYYQSVNPDLASMSGQALKNHYFEYGIYEGRRASRSFDPKYYIKNNADVSAAFGPENYSFALFHWYRYGMAQGRQGSADFSIKTYLSQDSALSAKYGTDYFRAITDWEIAN